MISKFQRTNYKSWITFWEGWLMLRPSSMLKNSRLLSNHLIVMFKKICRSWNLTIFKTSYPSTKASGRSIFGIDQKRISTRTKRRSNDLKTTLWQWKLILWGKKIKWKGLQNLGWNLTSKDIKSYIELCLSMKNCALVGSMEKKSRTIFGKVQANKR